MKVSRAIVLAWLAAVALAGESAVAGPSLDDDAAYVVRGRQTEARQLAFKERLVRFHALLSATLQDAAPDLLARLEPPPSSVSGYQLLPRIVPDAAFRPHTKPNVVSYYWGWSDTLYARENENLDRLELELAKLTPDPSDGSRADFEALVAGYQKAVASRRRIDADIDYNWLWQSEIAHNRPRYDKATLLLEAALERQALSEPMTPEILFANGAISPPAFVHVTEEAGQRWLITVPLTTDIPDSDFVQAFVTAVESAWQGQSGHELFRVRLDVETIKPESLYCAQAESVNLTAAPCNPPAKGEKIELAAHVARFPQGRAVLTTGAASLHITAGRALALGRHDVTPRSLAHEFGHILGIPDGYLRGYEDLGTDGFRIMELVIDPADIMGNSKAGFVTARHFEGIMDGREAKVAMRAGLDALYEQGDPVTAAAQFRTVLELNPAHYGATLQLAKALDRSGRPEEAIVLWKNMLEMAEAARDDETIQTARARLGGGE